MTTTIIVTGAGGYIGGQTAIQLKEQGYRVIGVDRSQDGYEHLKSYFDQWLTEDFASDTALDLMVQSQPQAIVHCAGTSLVGPSMKHPADYYSNNFVKTQRLADRVVSMPAEQRPRLIFSSSAAVYGNPIMTPCQEVDPVEPISPYGESKLMVEWMLRSYHNAYGLDYVAFRYFNACGADPQVRHGQAPGATHIIARVLESVKNNTEFHLMGTDYGTTDGTCVRDYVHVADIADAHVRAVDPQVPAGVYNLGTANGASNLQVIAAVSAALRVNPVVRSMPQREGDPAMLTASSDKFQAAAGWQPRYSIQEAVEHVWAWYNR